MINDNEIPYFVNFGGGVNSTAILLKLVEDGARKPEAVIFADTGGERPATYQHVEAMSAWLEGQGWPGVTVLRWLRVKGEEAGRFVPLEDWCLRHESLPSLAFGNKGCSVKWKSQPIDGWVKQHQAFLDAQREGQPVIRVLGYDADEPHRWNRSKDDSAFRWWAPLVEWDMGRHECEALMKRYGMRPYKSSCFFCPAMKAREIRRMMIDEPGLVERALQIEANSRGRYPNVGLAGPGRLWSTIVASEAQRRALFESEEDAAALDRWFDRGVPDQTCGCLD